MVHEFHQTLDNNSELLKMTAIVLFVGFTEKFQRFINIYAKCYNGHAFFAVSPEIKIQLRKTLISNGQGF